MIKLTLLFSIWSKGKISKPVVKQAERNGAVKALKFVSPFLGFLIVLYIFWHSGL